MSGISDYYSMFSDYLTNQKANSVNTRESYYGTPHIFWSICPIPAPTPFKRMSKRCRGMLIISMS